jgi:putative phosphoribosyl transferase
MPLSIQKEQVAIETGTGNMQAVLWLPQEHIGVVVLGSCGETKRLHPPNDYVASVLHHARLGTLWIDLLSPDEILARDKENDVAMLARRLHAACEWLRQHHTTKELPIGLFAASSAAAPAIYLAAERERDLAAIVLRGGRLDLAGSDVLCRNNVPTLLIIGGLDDGLVEQNRAAYASLRCKKKLEIVPGATRAFDEPGCAEVVARLARAWFVRHASSRL